MLISYHVYIYIDEQTEKSYTRYFTIDILRQAGYIWALRKELIVFYVNFTMLLLWAGVWGSFIEVRGH